MKAVRGRAGTPVEACQAVPLGSRIPVPPAVAVGEAIREGQISVGQEDDLAPAVLGGRLEPVVGESKGAYQVRPSGALQRSCGDGVEDRQQVVHGLAGLQDRPRGLSERDESDLGRTVPDRDAASVALRPFEQASGNQQLGRDGREVLVRAVVGPDGGLSVGAFGDVDQHHEPAREPRGWSDQPTSKREPGLLYDGHADSALEPGVDERILEP